MISIHAPREGGDQPADCPMRTSWIFQSTPPVRGGDVSPPSDCSKDAEFQSTPPARGATLCCSLMYLVSIFQSTPPARGATYFTAAGILFS